MKLTFSQAMDKAYSMAIQAEAYGDIPIGAVVLDSQQNLVSSAGNCVERYKDASAHAEIMALRQAACFYNTTRLYDHTLVVTLEPCMMCACAIGHFRIERLIYGAYDIKGGGIDHGGTIFYKNYTLHKPKEIISGFRERECAALLRNFFKKKR